MTIELSAQNWQQLSPLLDRALELDARARERWLATDAAVLALPLEQCERLRVLLKHHSAPETTDIFATLPLLAHASGSAFDLAANDVVGPYTLIELVGEGGMAQVWRARRSDGAYRREVALKLPLIHGNAAARDHFLRRIERERDLLARLEHPNIARFYDAGVAKTLIGAQPYLAMEYVDGVPITQYAQREQLAVEDRCKLFLSVLDAVQFAHQQFVIHRDLKPSNILVRRDGTVALLDFGVAKMLDDSDNSEGQHLTRDIGRAVTVAYASPEQLSGEILSASSDVYSAGIMLYELLCGERPFSGSDRYLLSRLATLEQPIPPMAANVKNRGEQRKAEFASQSASAHARQLLGDLQAIIDKALRRDAQSRYQTAAAFREDLRRYLQREPVLARQGVLFYRLRKFSHRYRNQLALSATALVAVSILGALTWQSERAQQAADIRATSIETLFDGLLDSVDPELAETKTFSVEDILDQIGVSLTSGSYAQRQAVLAVRVAEMYDALGKNAKAKALLDQYATLAKDAGSKVGESIVEIQSVNNLLSAGDIASARKVLDALNARTVDDSRLLSSRVLAEMHLLAAEGRYRDVIAAAENQTNRAEAKSNIDALLPAYIEQARGFAHAQLGELDAARHHYALASKRLAGQGKRAWPSVQFLNIQLAEVSMQAGEYDRAIIDASSALAALRTRYPENHRGLFNAYYVKAASLVYSGRHDEAKEAVTKYLDATQAHSEHRALARNLYLRLLSYQGQCVTANAAIESDLRSLQTDQSNSNSANDQSNSNSPNWAQVSSLRRLRAECWLRARNTDSAVQDLKKLLDGESSATAQVPLRRAYTEALLGIGLLMRGDHRDAQALLLASLPSIRTARGEHDSTFVAANAFAALLADDRAARNHAADLIEKHLLWQDGARDIVERLRAPVDLRRESPIPFIF
jgi:serine/threonine protein kinase